MRWIYTPPTAHPEFLHELDRFANHWEVADNTSNEPRRSATSNKNMLKSKLSGNSAWETVWASCESVHLSAQSYLLGKWPKVAVVNTTFLSILRNLLASLLLKIPAIHNTPTGCRPQHSRETQGLTSSPGAGIWFRCVPPPQMERIFVKLDGKSAADYQRIWFTKHWTCDEPLERMLVCPGLFWNCESYRFCCGHVMVLLLGFSQKGLFTHERCLQVREGASSLSTCWYRQRCPKLFVGWNSSMCHLISRKMSASVRILVPGLPMFTYIAGSYNTQLLQDQQWKKSRPLQWHWQAPAERLDKLGIHWHDHEEPLHLISDTHRRATKYACFKDIES